MCAPALRKKKAFDFSKAFKTMILHRNHIVKKAIP